IATQPPGRGNIFEDRNTPYVQDESVRMVSLDMFHKVCYKLGLSISMRHSRILWILISLQNYPQVQQFIPEQDVKAGVLRIYLQPVDKLGKFL
ncbi:hypothetical protein IE077_000938, partial [Cardiosporidium cionae]